MVVIDECYCLLEMMAENWQKIVVLLMNVIVFSRDDGRKSAFRVKGCLELSLHLLSLCMVLTAGLCFIGLAFEVMVDDSMVLTAGLCFIGLALK